MSEKICRECGFVYEDGCNFNTIMDHIKKCHMGEKEVEN